MSFTHQLELSITFDADPTQPRFDEDGERLLSRYRTARPVSIYSCAAGWASVVLPEVSDTKRRTRRLALPLTVQSRTFCVAQYSAIECLSTLEQENAQVIDGRRGQSKYSDCICGGSFRTLLRDEDEAEAGSVCTSVLLRQRLSGWEPPQRQAEPQPKP
jgi:hypothetical protein